MNQREYVFTFLMSILLALPIMLVTSETEIAKLIGFSYAVCITFLFLLTSKRNIELKLKVKP